MKIEASAKKVGYTIPDGALVATASEEASVRQAVDLVREGKSDFLMKGKVTTATLIRGIVDKERGLRTGSQLSQVIVFQVGPGPPIPKSEWFIAPTLPTMASSSDGRSTRTTAEAARSGEAAHPHAAL